MENSNPFLSLPKSVPPSVEQAETAQQQSSNPFLSLPKTGQQPTVQQEQAPSSQGWFMDKVEIMNRGFERYALGGMQLMNAGIRNTMGQLPIVGEAITNDTYGLDAKIKQLNDKSEASYNAAYGRTPSPVMDFVGNVGGAIVASAPAVMATTAAGPMTAVGAVGQGVASGVMGGAMDYSESNSDRLYKAGISGAIGGAIPATMYGGQRILEHFVPGNSISSFVRKFFFPAEQAKQDVAQAIVRDSADNVDDAMAKVAAVQQSGTNQGTPGELMSKNPKSQIRQLEKSISVDDAGKDAVAKSIVGRTEAVKKQIYDTIDTMNTPELQQTQTNGFAGMKQEYVLPDGSLVKGDQAQQWANAFPESANYVPDVIKNNKALSKLYTAVQNADIPEWKDMHPNSIEFLHKIKDAIDDDLYNAKPNKVTGAIASAIKLIPKKELSSASGKLKTVLEQSDNYNAAMASSHIIKRNEYYKEMIKGVETKEGSGGELTLEQLSKAVIPNTFRKEEFIKDVVDAGGDAVQAKELIKVADSLKGAPLWTVMKGQDPSTYVGGNKEGMIQRLLSNMALKDYHKALLDLTLSGDKWADDIASVLATKGKEAKQVKYLELIKKVFDGDKEAAGDLIKKSVSDIVKGIHTAEKTTRGALTNTAVESARALVDD